MPIFNTALEVISENQTAIVLFTHGDQFTFDNSGRGSTGKWVLDPEMLDDIQKVIIYLRRSYESINRIYLGDFTSCRQSDLARRYIIFFSGLKEVGTSASNWLAFSGGGQNPVSYIMGAYK